MAFVITAIDYAEYIKKAYEFIHQKGDYVTELDLATGDGDHWTNINMGFEKLMENIDKLAELPIDVELKEIGKTMMSVIGGSSGVLYGSAYLAAGKCVKGKESLGKQELYDVLEAMLNAVISRGRAKEGFKTMIDSLSPAVKEYKKCMEENIDDKTLCERVKNAAIKGAEKTKDMEAVRGRASYQTNKGVGHLDPGAVTMSYQISVLMDCIMEKFY